MDQEITLPKYLGLAKYSSWGVFVLGILYATTTMAGLGALVSADEPIGQPYFAIMELLILLIAPLMLVSMIGVHYCAGTGYNLYSLMSVGCMLITAAITSCVHFLVLATGSAAAEHPFLFSFRWPSLIYVLDILAWDWFFALSMLFAAFSFRRRGLEKIIRMLMILSGLLSLAGLGGIPAGNMMIRNIGIAGYALIAPVVFLLLGTWFRNRQQAIMAFGAIH